MCFVIKHAYALDRTGGFTEACHTTDISHSQDKIIYNECENLQLLW